MKSDHEKLKRFKNPDKVDTTPLLKDLYQHITPQYAADWKVIGTLLSLPSGELKAIEAGYPTNVKWCCNQMLEKWLEMDATATWGKIFTVIESSAMSNVPNKATSLTFKLDQSTITHKGTEAVAILSNRVSQINVQTRFMVEDSTWPPEQLASFTPLLLISYQGHRTQEQVTEMAKLMYFGKVASVTGDQPAVKCTMNSHATKQIEELLGSLERSKQSPFVLIEGAPGIGKSVLLKEIAFRWGKKQLLQEFELVLLVFLRDPSLQQIQSVDDLLQLFCRGDRKATEIASSCSEYLFANGGKSLLLLLDGYDEYPEHLQKCSLIADIIKRQVLPLCGLLISSRPHASEHLHKQATIRVDVLGFTEAERLHFIRQALPDQPHKVKELTQFLMQQPSVDSICFIPFNMAILLYLYKLGISLPKNSTELYHHFICSNICRHLSKFGNPHNITNLSSLPEPYNRIIKQLSKLSLEALNCNKLIFTLDEITAASPDIATIPGAINGFGLLQAVQHFGLYGKTMTLNFIHFTIQEFLAAHYISHLPPNEDIELKVIKANFWNNVYFNMFSMYISLTKGQRPSFKRFLSGENKAIVISHKFLRDQLKCLRLYCCFNEANDQTMCSTIEHAEIFRYKEIRLGHTALAASDMECISSFLTSSFNKKWEWLNLTFCYIQDKGLNILYHRLCNSNDVTINELWLSYNGLTRRSSSLISKLTGKCKVKILRIAINHSIGEDQQLYSMLTDSSNLLEQLDMHDTLLSSRAANALFKALEDNCKLKELYIADNAITDDACDAITTALERNNCLATLSMYGNPLCTESIVKIVQSLEVNNTLQLLGLPKCPEDIQENIRLLQEVANKKRESQGCQAKLEIEFNYV